MCRVGKAGKSNAMPDGSVHVHIIASHCRLWVLVLGRFQTVQIMSCPSIIAKAAEAANRAAEAAAASAAAAAAQKAKEKPKSAGLTLSSISLLNASGDNINKSGKVSEVSAPPQSTGWVKSFQISDKRPLHCLSEANVAFKAIHVWP